MKKNWKKVVAAVGLAAMMVTGCAGGSNGGNGGTENKTAAENGNKAYKIGIVQYMDHVSLEAARKGFEDQMNESGLNVEMEYKNANGDAALTTQIPQKFVGDGCDLIYAIATPAAQGAKTMAKDIPLIFSAVTDPVESELVKSKEAPGGNCTGVVDYMDPKGQLETFLKIYPDVKKIGVIYNTGEANSRVQLEELKKVCGELGLELKEMGVSSVNDVPTAITSLKADMDALFAMTDNTVASAAPLVAKTLREEKIPSLSAEEGQVKNGLLISEGVDYYEQGKQAARMAVEILEKGADPATTPVQDPENTSMVVNKETAEALGLDLNQEIFKNAKIID